MRGALLALVPAVLLSAACGPNSPAPKPDVLTADEVAAWAPDVSALGAYLSIYEPLAVYDGQSPYSDPSCPVVVRDDTTLTITGNCKNSSGQTWSGVVSMELSTQVLTFSDFGSGNTQSGSASIGDGSPTSRDFAIELTSKTDGSEIAYQGHVDGGYDARTVWNGSGTFVRRSGQTSGTVEATTTNEVVDDSVCSGQPASGTTQLGIRNHVAVITYDGSVDCGNGAADVSVDGEPQGTITGVSCSISSRPGAGDRGRAVWLAFALGAAFVRRRERCSRTNR